MVFWALIVMIFNHLGQAMAMPENGESVGSSIAEESPIRTSDSNAPVSAEAFSRNEQDRSLDKNGGDPNKPLIDLIFMGQGFALNGNESHALFVSIQKIRHIDPMKIRGLMNTNKSLEELKEAINEQKAEIIYGGEIKLSEKSYRLANVSVTRLQTCLSIEGDLMSSHEAKSSGIFKEVKGQIVLMVPESKISDTCRGELTINADGFIGTYQVLLKTRQTFDDSISTPASNRINGY